MSNTPNNQTQLAVCVRNDGYPASLEVRKIYRVLPDSGAATAHLLRVVDESGEDYLYPDSYFVVLDLPATLRDTLLAVA
jgi:hypothetical protein